MVSLSSIGKAALDLIYPPRCALCGRGNDFLCDDCLSRLPRATGARCPVCWKPLAGVSCWTCDEEPRSFRALRSTFRYEGEVRRLVHAFKFGGQSSLAATLAGLLHQTYLENGLDVDVIVPVPLARGRQRHRGYNQAALLAKELSGLLDLPHSQALRRPGSSSVQSASPSAAQRRRNVAGAFSIARPEEVAGRRVLLVDDVATTGATLNACAAELLNAGATSVSALTLARED